MLEHDDDLSLGEYGPLVRMEVLDVSKGHLQGNQFYVLLAEKEGEYKRKLTVMVGAAEAQAILVKLRRIEGPRPTMPDLMCRVLMQTGIGIKEVTIDRVEDGIYYSHIDFYTPDQGIVRIESRLSDALALALRVDAPVFCLEKVLREQSIKEKGDGVISIPITSVGINVLREALKSAVNEENFEIAARLRDEIARREQLGKQDDNN